MHRRHVRQSEQSGVALALASNRISANLYHVTSSGFVGFLDTGPCPGEIRWRRLPGRRIRELGYSKRGLVIFEFRLCNSRAVNQVTKFHRFVGADQLH